MIIDFHTHIVPPGLKERRNDYLGLDPCFDILYSQPEVKLATADDLIASMDESGVDISVVLNIGWTDHELCVTTNDYILESVARYPRRLVGFCVINPSAGEVAVQELERCIRGGARGIGELRPDTQGFDPSNKRVMDPIAEMAQQQRLTVVSHSSEPVGHQYPGKGKVTLDMLYGLISTFHSVPIICAHWGGGLPFYALMPEVAEALQNVFFDTAATRFLYSTSVYSHIADIVSPDKILMGSDYPLILQKEQVAEVNSLDLSREFKEKVLGGNARGLLDSANS